MEATTNNASPRRIPMILTGQALNSLRDAGFDLPTALGEPADNSLEANANNVWIWLDEAQDRRGKKHIHRIVIGDDGSGMPPEVLHHYLQIGYSTRYMSTTTIGKYGVGAKLAALNFATRIDVWSRTKKTDPWLHTFFDLKSAQTAEEDGHAPGIDPPTAAAPPQYLDDRLPEGTGTVVVWSGIDRLEEGRLAENAEQLAADVIKELSRMYRYFLDGGRKIHVNGKELRPHDPLMLMQNSWSDFVLTKHRRAGEAKEKDGKQARRGEDKSGQLDHFPAKLIWEEPIKIGGEAATLRITLYPPEVTRKRGLGGDKLALELKVPDNEGSISFVRLDREVSYTNVPRIFGRQVQPQDRFVGIEVKFTPALDRFFGIRHVKRGVEPHGELRNKIRAVLEKYVPSALAELEQRWGQVAVEAEEQVGEHAAVTEALTGAARTMPTGPAGADTTPQEQQEALEDLANDVIGDAEDKKKEREEYIERVKALPFVIESVNFPGVNFLDVQYIANTIVIRVNTRHKFYKEMWAPMRELAKQDPASVSGADAVKAARRTVEALTLLVVAYAKAESMHPNPHEQYGELRNHWGGFLDSLLGKIKNVL